MPQHSPMASQSGARSRLCSYTFARLATTYRDDVWPSRPNSEDDRLFDGLARDSCRYCGSQLLRNSLLSECHYSRDVARCPECGWWRLKECTVGGQDNVYIELVHGEAKHYSIDALEVPILDLRSYLKRHPIDMGLINPVVFEHLIRDCLRSAFAPCEVLHIGGTGDGGVDLKLIISETETYLVQVKRRTDIHGREGVDVVRQLNGVLFREGRAKGIVVTSASGFTKAARMEAAVRTQTAEPYEIKLVSFPDIVSMLKLPSMTPYEPWVPYLDKALRSSLPSEAF
jgi:hypothetical protein